MTDPAIVGGALAHLARVAELADATDSKSVGLRVVRVQVPPRALASSVRSNLSSLEAQRLGRISNGMCQVANRDSSPPQSSGAE